jgi:hypothetical protein
MQPDTSSGELFSILIGLMVTTAVYISMRRVFVTGFASIKRAVGVFAGICGILTTFWLMENPEALQSYWTRIATGGLAVVLALLALARGKTR